MADTRSIRLLGALLVLLYKLPPKDAIAASATALEEIDSVLAPHLEGTPRIRKSRTPAEYYTQITEVLRVPDDQPRLTVRQVLAKVKGQTNKSHAVLKAMVAAGHVIQERHGKQTALFLRDDWERSTGRPCLVPRLSIPFAGE